MRRITKIVITLLLISYSLLLTPYSLRAQEPPPLSVTVDRATLSPSDTLLLTIEVNSPAMSSPQPTLPPFTGFNVVGRSNSSQISIINGAISSKVIYQYRLQPAQSGTLTIAPVTVTVNDQTHSSQPIIIQVTAGAAPTSPPPPANPPTASGGGASPTGLVGQDLYVESEVDNAKPYLGQQIVYTFRFYQGINLYSQPRYNPPKFTGFWNESQPEQSQHDTQAANRVYRVTELRTILFPTVVGATTFEESSLMIPGGLFDQDTVLKTQPIPMEVRPLPPDAPPEFKGAIGQFTITATLNLTQTKVNEPITLLVTLSGKGNINNLPDPVWPELAGWRAFQSKATMNSQVAEGKLGGQRVYERLMVPGKPGNFTIPPLSYTYFDPLSGQYLTAKSEPLAVNIAPGVEQSAVPVVIGGDKEAIQLLGSDIRHLKPMPDPLPMARPLLTDRPSYWLAWIVPLLILGLNFGAQQYQDYLKNNVSLIRSSQARKKAKTRIDGIKGLTGLVDSGNPANPLTLVDPYSVVGQILTTYIAEKLNQPVVGLTHKALAQTLVERGVNESLTQVVEQCLMACDLGRFAPGGSEPGHAADLLTKVGWVIDELDKEMGK